MSEDQELPPGWAEAPLSRLAGAQGVFIDGDWVESKDQDPSGDVRLIQLADVGDGDFRDRSSRFMTRSKAEELRCTFLEPGDVLISRMADPLGRACIFPGDAKPSVTVVDVAILREVEINHAWLVSAINAPQFRAKILAESSGTTRGRVSRSRLGAIGIVVPPVAEQRRIVAKLDELRARSRKAREALEEVPALLDKLKQSVLAAAFRGDLTAAWRAAQPPGSVEPASVLLDRIRTERRSRWEQANPKKKYVEPEPVDPEGLPDLPEGWCWTTIGDALDVYVGATPSRKVAAYWGGTIPWVSSGEVSFCRIVDTRERITEDGLRNTSTTVHPAGTVLIGMIGEGRTRGQVAILGIPACNNQNSAAIRVEGTGVLSEFLYRYLESQYERSRSLGSGNNQPALNKSRVEAMWIPLAPIAEQRVMSVALEALFDVWTDLKASRAETCSTLDSLDQSILAKAFRGELVPQDPTDEPADVLLARIQAAASASPAKKAGRKPRSSAG